MSTGKITNIKDIEIEALRQRIEFLELQVQGYRQNCERLERQLRERESQSPVTHQYQDRSGVWRNFIDERHFNNTVEDGTWPIRALYAEPVSSKRDEPKSCASCEHFEKDAEEGTPCHRCFNYCNWESAK